MTLQARACLTAGALLVLAVAGEFVGAARRRILRREVPQGPIPALRGGQVLVRVKGADGRPIPQAALAEYGWSASAGPSSGGRRTSGMTAAYVILGSLGVDDPVRWVEIWSPVDTADDPIPFGAVLLGPLDPSATAIDVVLPAEAAISGSIRRGQVLLKGVKVRARVACPESFAFLVPGDSWHSLGETDAEGSFRLGRLGAGMQEVSFEGPVGYAIAGRRVEGGGRVDVDLDAGRIDAVTVLDGNGRPVGNALVSAEEAIPGRNGARRPRARGNTDWTGVVRFHGLDPAAKLRLVVWRPGTGPGSQGEEQDWTPSTTTFHLRKQRALQVKVLDEKGGGHPGVAITALPEEAGRPGVTGTTGPDGKCRLTGIDAGGLTVTAVDTCAIRPEGASAVRTVAADEAEVSFTMARGASITVSTNGYMTPGMTAFLREEGGTAAATGTYRGQVVTWHGLKAGATYGVVLANPAWNWAVRVDGNSPSATPLTVNLAPAFYLSASVQWPEGAGDGEVHAAFGDQVLSKGTQQGGQGLWVVPCLPAGRYEIVATCSVPGRKEKARASVEGTAGGSITIVVK